MAIIAACCAGVVVGRARRGGPSARSMRARSRWGRSSVWDDLLARRTGSISAALFPGEQAAAEPAPR